VERNTTEYHLVLCGKDVRKMMKKGFNKRPYDQIDKYNAPTEPLPDIPAMLFPASDQSNPVPAVPPPFLSHVDPMQSVVAYPYAQTSSAGAKNYPYYPSLPGPLPGANYGVWPGDAAWNARNTTRRHARWRWLLPASVGLFFLCIQLLLIARFGIRFLSLSPDITWVGIVTSVSEVFVNPFRELWFQLLSVGTLVPANMEVYTLVAILIYGILSRMLVGFLKVMLKIR
jgi:hypothetical protein